MNLSNYPYWYQRGHFLSGEGDLVRNTKEEVDNGFHIHGFEGIGTNLRPKN
jgi:hypothetical protein